MAEDRIHGGHQFALRSPVGAQREAAFLRSRLRRAEVGEDVRAAEAVDGLLGIADEKQPAIVSREDAAKDFPLDRIGILKLINQRRLEFLPQGRGERRAAVGIGQGIAQAREQVVEGLGFRAVLARWKFGARKADEIKPGRRGRIARGRPSAWRTRRRRDGPELARHGAAC